MSSISRRRSVKALGASAALSTLSGQLSFAAPTQRRRPNLIYIMIRSAYDAWNTELLPPLEPESA